MKSVDDALSGTWIRRVFLSGVLLTVGVHPLIRTKASVVLSIYEIPAATVPLVEVIFFGLVISAASTWVFFLFEGFLATPLTWPGWWLNQRRLERLRQKFATTSSLPQTSASQDKLAVLQRKIRDYPLKREGEGTAIPEVGRPTLLGNVIETYERYPQTRYGIDGVAFWYHFLACAPEPLKEQFLEQADFAESLLLAAYAAATAGLLHLAVVAGLIIGKVCVRCTVDVAPFSLSNELILVATAAGVSWLFYRMAIPAHREAGTIFRAAVDLAIPRMTRWLKTAPTAISAETQAASRKLKPYLNSLQSPKS